MFLPFVVSLHLRAFCPVIFFPDVIRIGFILLLKKQHEKDEMIQTQND